VRCGGIMSTWRATRTPTLLYLPMSTSGAPYVPTETPRRRSPGALWDCPGWLWKCSGSTYSGKRTRGYGLAFCGRTTGSSSLQRSGRSSMRRMCAGVAPGNLQESGPRRGVDSARTARAITTAIPGHGRPKDAVVIARAYSATATAAFANGHGPDGLADEERQRPPGAGARAGLGARRKQ
jgi:hypothetical protein